MADRARPTVFVHVGAPKTGTTFLQQVAHANQDALRRDGLVYPANPRAHFLASQDLRDWRFQGHEDPQLRGAWQRLVAEARKAPDRVLISHESLGSATREHVDRAMADLDFADVHVVFTARDMARQLPAAWQERVRNRATTTFGEFLAEIRAPELTGPAKRFWALHGVPKILSVWARSIPPEHVHVVTVPPSGSDPLILWRRFATVLGIDPDAYDTSVKGANTSLGAAEVSVMRRFNEAIEDVRMPWPLYAEAFKRGLAPRMGSRSGERIGLPDDAYEWSVAWATRAVGKLERAGYSVEGDLADLVPTRRPDGVDPDAVPGDVQADVAIGGMRALVTMLVERSAGGSAASPDSANRRARPAAAATEQPPAANGTDADGLAARALDRVEDVARHVEWPESVKRGYRRVRRGRMS